MQEQVSKEDRMASRNHRTDDMNMRDEEQARVHEAYSRLGRMGGEKGGQIRREQMARGEIFTRETHNRLDQSPGEERQ
jgi:hypothetical protein